MTRPRGAEPSRRPTAAHRRSAPACVAPAGACSWAARPPPPRPWACACACSCGPRSSHRLRSRWERRHPRRRQLRHPHPPIPTRLHPRRERRPLVWPRWPLMSNSSSTLTTAG
eukprot:6650125-Prymnesium_polylepis.1